jgi:uncharacterized Zn-finger protein
MSGQKKNFSCSGNEFSPHPKVFFTFDSNQNDIKKNSCDDYEKKIENNNKNKASCPYCGKIFES